MVFEVCVDQIIVLCKNKNKSLLTSFRNELETTSEFQYDHFICCFCFLNLYATRKFRDHIAKCLQFETKLALYIIYTVFLPKEQKVQGPIF